MHDHIPILFPLESIKEVRKREKLLIHSHYLCSKKCQLMFFLCIMFTLNYHFQLIIHLLLPCSLYLYWYWGFNHDFFFFKSNAFAKKHTHTPITITSMQSCDSGFMDPFKITYCLICKISAILHLPNSSRLVPI